MSELTQGSVGLPARNGSGYLVREICAETKRLAEEWTYEPSAFYERNQAADFLAGGEGLVPAISCRSVVPRSSPSQDSVTSGRENEEASRSREVEHVID